MLRMGGATNLFRPTYFLYVDKETLYTNFGLKLISVCLTVNCIIMYVTQQGISNNNKIKINICMSDCQLHYYVRNTAGYFQ